MKKQLRAARANVLLLRYMVLTAAAAGFLAVAIVTVYVLMTTIKTGAENAVTENQSKIANYASIEAEAARFRANLATAKTILDKEVVYSKAILSIAQAIPGGVVLDNLNLDAKTFGSPTTFTARVRTYQDAINLKNKLEESAVFSNVYFSSISGGDTSSESGDYPYTVTVNLTIDKGIATR